MPVRCAIYARKSHDERADSQLSSTERQRELCESYIASQADADWEAATFYEDIGQSGGSLERPALQRMLADVDAGRVDVVVVYKIDRLSRSLRDFLNLVDRFDRATVTFVSVTQAFSTTNSMGRLTLNVLLSFAQFERDIIGERGRDWLAGARQRGLWAAGQPPYGYTISRLQLQVRPDQAEIVRAIYRRFVKLKSFHAVAVEMNDAGHRNRRGNRFDGRQIRAIVTSRTYRGEIPNRGGYLPGNHAAIVTERTWLRAQEVRESIEAKRTWRAKPGRKPRALKSVSAAPG